MGEERGLRLHGLCYDPRRHRNVTWSHIRMTAALVRTPMKADAIIKWFMPKEERFHDLLANDTENLVEATRLFAKIAHTESFEQRRVLVVELKGLEHEGDQITRQIFDALNSTFITPFDREDIRSIATDLDDILDAVESAGQNLVLFELSESPDGLRQFARILTEMAEGTDQLTRLVWDLFEREEDPRMDRTDLRPREPGRLALQHRHCRPVPRQRPRSAGDPEVEGGL